ncbi:MAG: DUF2062 domain-containing protein [Bernardetiaceae bacterium]|jgi:uncharacterized protein (DUF2062 family)|nr:DUF2062 domain-containing protein [Bernardetiaceae bacterium]
MPIARLFREKVLVPIAGALRQGASPQGLALAIAAGAVLGVFPLLGSTTLLCAGVSWAFRLNPVAIQAANYAVYPVQLVGVVLFFRWGGQLFGLADQGITPQRLTDLFAEGFFHAVGTLGLALVYAIFTWALAALPLFAGIYWLSWRLLARRAGQS